MCRSEGGVVCQLLILIAGKKVSWEGNSSQSFN